MNEQMDRQRSKQMDGQHKNYTPMPSARDKYRSSIKETSYLELAFYALLEPQKLDGFLTIPSAHFLWVLSLLSESSPLTFLQPLYALL